MRTVGLSVPDVVREIITRNRSIHDCMAMDVINYTALAVKIHPEVEKQIGNPIHLNTIVVAIKRYADAFEKDENVISEPVLKDARLSMTDRIMGMQWTMKDILDQDIARMLGEAEKALTNSEFFRLGDSFRILADDSDVTRKIFQNFPKENVYSSGLAKIRIQVPEQNRADVVSYVTEILHRNGIDLVDALFSRDGIVLILKEDQAPIAYEKLRTEIPRTKENLYSSGLAKIRIQVPEQNRADVVSYVTEILHRNGIDLVDALFSRDGIVLILKEDQAPIAYEKLRSEIPR